jgi:CHASE2 domain-containing sensor protein
VIAAGPQALTSELLVAVASTTEAVRSATAILTANAKYLGFGLAYSALGGLIAWRARPRRGPLVLGLVCAAIGANYICALEGTLFAYLGGGRPGA